VLVQVLFVTRCRLNNNCFILHSCIVMISYPLKQSFIDYFRLNQVDDTMNIFQFQKFLYKQLNSVVNLQKRALDIWDTFVLSNNNFFDIPEQMAKKDVIQQHREDIANCNNIYEIVAIFTCVGVSPYCHKC
jgi:hypothetical protein